MCVTHASRTNRRGPARINKVLIDVVIGLAITAAEDGKLRVGNPRRTCADRSEPAGPGRLSHLEPVFRPESQVQDLLGPKILSKQGAPTVAPTIV